MHAVQMATGTTICHRVTACPRPAKQKISMGRRQSTPPIWSLQMYFTSAQIYIYTRDLGRKG
uniref:Uncharacterized protein n=1 Tax=Aegilops tauschii subsp. strangulata TaxID=200361 RepID=A0A453FDY2_AEGTS